MFSRYISVQEPKTPTVRVDNMPLTTFYTRMLAIAESPRFKNHTEQNPTPETLLKPIGVAGLIRTILPDDPFSQLASREEISRDTFRLSIHHKVEKNNFMKAVHSAMKEDEKPPSSENHKVYMYPQGSMDARTLSKHVYYMYYYLFKLDEPKFEINLEFKELLKRNGAIRSLKNNQLTLNDPLNDLDHPFTVTSSPHGGFEENKAIPKFRDIAFSYLDYDNNVCGISISFDPNNPEFWQILSVKNSASFTTLDNSTITVITPSLTSQENKKDTALLNKQFRKPTNMFLDAALKEAIYDRNVYEDLKVLFLEEEGKIKIDLDVANQYLNLNPGKKLTVSLAETLFPLKSGQEPESGAPAGPAPEPELKKDESKNPQLKIVAAAEPKQRSKKPEPKHPSRQSEPEIMPASTSKPSSDYSQASAPDAPARIQTTSTENPQPPTPALPISKKEDNNKCPKTKKPRWKLWKRPSTSKISQKPKQKAPIIAAKIPKTGDTIISIQRTLDTMLADCDAIDVRMSHHKNSSKDQTHEAVLAFTTSLRQKISAFSKAISTQSSNQQKASEVNQKTIEDTKNFLNEARKLIKDNKDILATHRKRSRYVQKILSHLTFLDRVVNFFSRKRPEHRHHLFAPASFNEAQDILDETDKLEERLSKSGVRSVVKVSPVV